MARKSLQKKGAAKTSASRQNYWSGYLKLSLVTCPVRMVPATTEQAKVRFHTLNRETGNRVEAHYYDAETGRAVADADQVKGYEQAPGEDIVLEEEELQAIALESARTIDIEHFVPQDSVGWIWYDKPHFLMPNDAVGEEAFAVIREAMIATKTAALSRVVLYRRERPVMLVPRDKGIILWTLRYGDEVRAADEIFGRAEDAKVDKKSLALISKLIDKKTKPWSEAFVADPVEGALKKIIAAKTKKTPAKKKTPAEEAPQSNVIDIMDALRKSVEARKK